MCKCNTNKGYCQCASPKNGACCTCTPKLDLNKPVQLSDGTEARVICSNRQNEQGGVSSYPIVALVKARDGWESARYFSLQGHDIYSADKLINVPERINGWVNVFTHNLFPTEDKARTAANGTYSAYLKTIYIDVAK